MITNLHQLYHDQIRDLYSAENQLLEALPEMVRAATDNDLREAFQSHLEETRGHVDRLKTICSAHGIAPEGETCEAMKGLIKEGKKHLEATQAGPVRDAVLIASGNRVEHYEIAGYGVAKAFASVLGLDDDEKLLDDTIEEEGSADKKLTKLATGGMLSSGINEAAC
ncbi:ferritin-like domain-containing protein [Haloferula chungangensis]|uniref:Ferritin-like domain-containing protein n=1 Tax=Haloferula chungangensis TaxID=1048331 RepID=A0ABW2L547_9BACT